MTRRVVAAANRKPFLTALTMSTIVAVAGLFAVSREGNQRADDLRREQEEDARVIQEQAAERAAVLIRICEQFTARVELTFKETYDALAERAIAVGRPAPAVYHELSLIAEKNLNPAFCSPPALEEQSTTTTAP